MKKYENLTPAIAKSVRYYCRKYNLKIGYLEREIGVAAGYFARSENITNRDIALSTALNAACYISEQSKEKITVYNLLEDHGKDLIKDEIEKRRKKIEAEQAEIERLMSEMAE